MKPPISLRIALLLPSPMPMLPSFTSSRFYLDFSSRKGSNSIHYLSLAMPIPVSITSVTISHLFLDRFLKQFIVITILPKSWLYFTAFYTILNRISSYFSQSIVMSLSPLFTETKTWMLRYSIIGKKGNSTYSTTASGLTSSLSFSSNCFLLILIRWI